MNNKKTKFLGVKDSIIVVSILFITGNSTVSVSNGTYKCSSVKLNQQNVTKY